MEITTNTIAGIAGVVVAIGAVVAAFAQMMNNNQQPMYETPGQGPVQTQYVPQHPVYQQPVYQQPVQPPFNQPVPHVAPYCSEYPWGYNAYVAYIANTPIQNPQPVYPTAPAYQPTYSGPVYTYDFEKFNRKKMAEQAMYQTMGAPPGQIPSPWVNQPQSSYLWETPTIDASQVPAYTRTYANGYTSFCKIPVCYDSSGSWVGF